MPRHIPPSGGVAPAPASWPTGRGALACLLALTACTSSPGENSDGSLPGAAESAAAADSQVSAQKLALATLPRITPGYFLNSIHDLFGSDAPVPAGLSALPIQQQSEAISAASAALGDPPSRARAIYCMSTAPCSGCHLRMDAIGLGFELFNGTGALQLSQAGIQTTSDGIYNDGSYGGVVAHDAYANSPTSVQIFNRR